MSTGIRPRPARRRARPRPRCPRPAGGGGAPLGRRALAERALHGGARPARRPDRGAARPVSAWLVLVVRLPSQPSSRRVRAWRRLRTLGAVALKNSVWVLPFSPESYEQLQWLRPAVHRDGGEATLLKVDRVENMAPETLRRLFNDTRDHDYRDLAERYRGLLRALERRGGRGAPGRPPARGGPRA